MTDDAEPVFDEKGPERTCIVTRAKGDPRHMLRFVVGPGGDVVPDLRARLPGRGAWVTGASSGRRDGGQAPDLSARLQA